MNRKFQQIMIIIILFIKEGDIMNKQNEAISNIVKINGVLRSMVYSKQTSPSNKKSIPKKNKSPS